MKMYSGVKKNSFEKNIISWNKNINSVAFFFEIKKACLRVSMRTKKHSFRHEKELFNFVIYSVDASADTEFLYERCGRNCYFWRQTNWRIDGNTQSEIISGYTW